jgi:hypothetical protein
VKTFDGTKSNTNNEVDFLKRQIKQLEDKLKRHQQQRSVAEKPYVDRKQFQKEDEAFEEANQKPRSKVSHIVRYKNVLPHKTPLNGVS